MQKLVLGTAQFGMKYGLDNNNIFRSKRIVNRVLKEARKNKIYYLDTALSYGDAQKKIGLLDKNKKFKIITKIDKIGKINNSKIKNYLKVKISQILKDLRREYIDVLLIHNFSDLKKNKKSLLKALSEFKKKKLIKKIGISVYTPDQAIYSLELSEIKFLQIPFNILDQRWLNEKFLSSLEKRQDVEIQARSIFLRGLILSKYKKWPKKIINSKDMISKIDKIIKKTNTQNKLELSTSYIRSFKWINYITFGINSLNQFRQVIKYSKGKKLNFIEKKLINNSFKDLNEKILIPTNW